MVTLTKASGQSIANDTVAMFADADKALISATRLQLSVLEGFQDSGMHPRTKQKLLEKLSSSQSKLLESRRESTDVHLELLAIQKSSNLDTVNWGCWGLAMGSANATVGNSAGENPSRKLAIVAR
jgi:hypothetical protein